MTAAGFAKLVLYLSALAFGAVALGFWFAPAEMAARVGISLDARAAYNDVRAVYGGLQLGVAAFLVLCARRTGWLAFGLAAQLLCFAGLVLARFYSLLADGVPGTLALALHGAEIVALACGFAAWRALHRSLTREA